MDGCVEPRRLGVCMDGWIGSLIVELVDVQIDGMMDRIIYQSN